MKPAAVLLSLVAVFGPGVPGRAADDPRFFETRIRPLLAEHCFACHGPMMQKSNLRLDSAEAFARGGASGEPTKNAIIGRVRHPDEAKRMPFKGRLTERQIADVETWVKSGAPYPKAVVAAPSGKHWAFQPVVDPSAPAVTDTSWAKTPLDRFILAKLEEKGLKPSPPAEARTLIRRATFDLTGLPPTVDEVERFIAESGAKPQAAYENLIDRLLASSAYGERWGRHWLDVARYADSNGLDENICFGNAWRYRDYVIAAFNKDKPYDQFLAEQIAGDLLPSSDEATRIERLIATGFLALGPKVLAEVDEKKMEMDIIDEQVDTVGRAVMGLTTGCARCHDHKFDPLAQEDYYGLAGVFMSTKTMEHFKKIAKWHENPLPSPDYASKRVEHDKAVAALKEKLKAANAADEQRKLKEELAKLEKAAPEGPSALGVAEGKIVNAPLLPRGNHVTPGKEVARRFPTVLAGEKQLPLPEKQSGRLELAKWLTAKDHPLTARVMVNRVWRWHFGRGIVATVDNFGRIGDKPSHPELLDWLAARFVEDGWSLKKLHKRIMLSATYRMSSAHDAKSAEVDPDNRLLWRMNVRRLEAEAIRDSLLFVGGQLDRTMGGPAITHVKNREFLFDHTSKDGTTYDSKRRSVYLPVVRNHLYDVFQLFDATDATVSSGDRPTTTVATQALFWMNSPLVKDAATLMVSVGVGPKDVTQPRKRLRLLYLNAYGREPNEVEAQRMSDAYVQIKNEMRRQGDTIDIRERAWAAIAHVILSANEFVYVE